MEMVFSVWKSDREKVDGESDSLLQCFGTSVKVFWREELQVLKATVSAALVVASKSEKKAQGERLQMKAFSE